MFRLSAAAALAAVLCGAPLAGGQSEEPGFQVNVQLVTVIATVKDASGALVADLAKDDFTVLAGGVPQQVTLFERQTGRPLSVVLLFDASLSVAKELRFEQDAAHRFVRRLLTSGAQPEDRVAVYKFSSSISELTDFTASLARLEKAIYMMRPESGTSLYDAVYLAAEHLERREGRKVIIVVTDGGDTTSNKKFSDALAAAQRAEAVVYSIIVVPVTADAGRNLGGENALRTISASTGGVCYRQYSERDLDQAFRQIERDLRIQYLLGFYPRDVPPSKDRYYRLEVQVQRPGLEVLARTGYYGEASPSSGVYPEPAVSVTGTNPRARPKSPPASTSQPKRSPRSIP